MSSFIYRGCQFDDISEEKRNEIFRHLEYNPAKAQPNKSSRIKQQYNHSGSAKKTVGGEHVKKANVGLVDKLTCKLSLEDTRRAHIICSIR